MQNNEDTNNFASFNYQKELHSGFLELLYLLNNKHPLRHEIQNLLIMTNYIIMLLLYLSLPEISLFEPFLVIDHQIVILCMFASIMLILVECFIGVMYGKHIFLKLQIILYRNVVFPIAFFAYFRLSNQTIAKEIVTLVVILSILILFGMEYFLGRQSFAKNLLVDQGPPISQYTFLFQLFLCIYFTKRQQWKIVALFALAITGLATKFGVIDKKLRRSKCLQYTLFKIHASTNLVYVSFLLFNQILKATGSDDNNYQLIFPLIFFLILTEVFSEYVDQMKPLPPNFFNQIEHSSRFLQCVQYFVDDYTLTESTEVINISSTSLIPVYYEHFKNCKRLDCPLSHDLSCQTLSPNGQYRNLSSMVFRIFENLFTNFITIQNDNLTLKFAFLKFYQRTASNKFKIMHIITELEKKSLSFFQRINLYAMKRYVSDMEVGELTHHLKVEDYFESFNHSISSLMRLLIQFWSQFLEERVDFQKIFKIKQKMTPILKSMELQLNQSLAVETFSTIRIMKIYSQFCRTIINDEMKSEMTNDYIRLLNKKMSEVHELNYITADMQIGLIAISLNIKKLGEIKMCNNQAANIFNHQKQDFTKLNVSSIMPQVFAKYHNDFLKVFIGNQKRKINIDKRLMLGKKKQGSIFQIYLQLQKSLLASYQQLVFVANIEVVKVHQAHILIVCDDKGSISDTNSAYKLLFEKNKRKKRGREIKSPVNIQEIIPNFFHLVMDDAENEPKTCIECIDNSVIGIAQIKFEITKISFKHVPNAGYFLRGTRIIQPKQQLFKSVSLSQTLMQLAQENKLEGIKINYSPNENEYLFNEEIDSFGNFQNESSWTIPYAKLDLFGKLLDQGYKNKVFPTYDLDIKTIRFCGDHFERIQEPESFQSEIDEQQKTTINNSKFGLLKQKLQNQKNASSQRFPQILFLLYGILVIIILSIFFAKIRSQNQSDLQSAQQFKKTYKFRSQLSQYVYYFQSNSSIYRDFFMQQKQLLKSNLIKQISQTNLPQQQKQRALKVVYLQETLNSQSFQNLINDQTFFLQPVNIQLNQTSFTSLKVILGVLILLKLGMNLFIVHWHQKKLFNIFSIFLNLSQSNIKECHKKCVQFLSFTTTQNQGEQKIGFEPDQNEQQFPHIKIRRFKNLSFGKFYSYFLKLSLFSLLSIILFSAMLITDWQNTNKLLVGKQTFEFISSVMPQYSTKLMKSYSQKKQSSPLSITQTFTNKYQTFQYKLANLKMNRLSHENFLQEMFINQCNNFNLNIPNTTSCQTISSGVMLDGVSNAVNLIATRIAYIQSQPIQPGTFDELDQFAVLLYHLVQPIILNIQQKQRQHIISLTDTISITLVVYFVLFLLICVLEYIYQSHQTLYQISQNIINSKLLLRFMPETNKKVFKNGYQQI